MESDGDKAMTVHCSDNLPHPASAVTGLLILSLAIGISGFCLIADYGKDDYNFFNKNLFAFVQIVGDLTIRLLLSLNVKKRIILLNITRKVVTTF
jgi:hypothetical protein